MSTTATVYRAFDAENRLLYVGVTDDVFARWSQHGKGRDGWTSYVTHIELQRHPDRASADVAELTATADVEHGVLGTEVVRVSGG